MCKILLNMPKFSKENCQKRVGTLLIYIVFNKINLEPATRLLFESSSAHFRSSAQFTGRIFYFRLYLWTWSVLLIWIHILQIYSFYIIKLAAISSSGFPIMNSSNFKGRKIQNPSISINRDVYSDYGSSLNGKLLFNW